MTNENRGLPELLRSLITSPVEPVVTEKRRSNESDGREQWESKTDCE